MDEESQNNNIDKNSITEASKYDDGRRTASPDVTDNIPMTSAEASSERLDELKYSVVAADEGGDEEMGMGTEFCDPFVKEGENNPEDLPVAYEVPIARPASIFADIGVWEYARPFYEPNFGAEPDEDIFAIPERGEEEARAPVFSEADKANPCRCALKMICIILILPFYGIYKLLDYVCCGE